MKSPEKIGGTPEYNKAEWEELKQGGEAFAINKGKEIGVPREELDRFAEDVVARETKNHNYAFIYRFMKGMGIGTEKELRAVGEKAYQSFCDAREFGSAMAMAEDVYGRDSTEYKRANEASEAEWKKAEVVENVIISKDATFADLFHAIKAIKEGSEVLHFEEELWDNFDAEIVEEVLAFRDARASKAAITKVLDFFKEHGYTQSDISTFLPIKFKREQRKK